MANVLNNLFNAKIMSGELMTLRDLRVQTLKERREGRLTKLPSHFYRRVYQLEANIRKFIDYCESRNCSQNNYEILYPVSLHMFTFDTWFAEQCPTN